MAEWWKVSNMRVGKQRAIVLKPKNIEQRILTLYKGLREEGLRVPSGMKYQIANLPAKGTLPNQPHSAIRNPTIAVAHQGLAFLIYSGRLPTRVYRGTSKGRLCRHGCVQIT